MPRFEPFRGLRYDTSSGLDITSRTSPPYDVFGPEERTRYASAHPANIVHVDYPVESTGDGRYDASARIMREWVRSGVVVRENAPAFYIYRMNFSDETGRQRTTCGVVGGLEVVDQGSPEVLPHEQTTPKDKTDRLDLTRATHTNLSPVWGLSLTPGLTHLLAEPGNVVATCVDDEGVTHTLEAVTDPGRIDQIRAAVATNPVLIADGHHRYAISRSYRDEQRVHSGESGAELTMTYVQELVEDQLSVAAIHRVYDVAADTLLAGIATSYTTEPAGAVGATTLGEMANRGCLCLVDSHGVGTYLYERAESFDGVRAIDSVRLETALDGTEIEVRYQHGVDHVLERLRTGDAKSAILIRPVSIEEIRRTADTGELMPPKSTFFTPKLRTGMVMRPLD